MSFQKNRDSPATLTRDDPKSLRRRNRSGSRDSLACLDVVAALPSVLLRRQRIVAQLLRSVRLVEVASQKRNAPAATGSRSAALGKLAGSTRIVNPLEVEDLPLRDVEAVTNRVIQLHDEDSECVLFLLRRGPQFNLALNGSPFQTDLLEQRIENLGDGRLL